MHDRASINSVVMRTIKVMYPLVLDIGCFSHTIDHVGEKFVTPVLDEFVSAWVLLFSHSPKSRLAWQSRVGRSVKSLSKTRWWSRWEVINQLLELFGDIEPFLVESDDLGPRMLSILQDPLTNYACYCDACVYTVYRYFGRKKTTFCNHMIQNVIVSNEVSFAIGNLLPRRRVIPALSNNT